MQNLVMFGKGSCWDLHWVLKPRQASKRPVASTIKFSYKTKLCLGDWIELHSGGSNYLINCTSVGGIGLCI